MLPSGTVTLLFTDVEGSTLLLNELGDAYGTVLADHRALLEKVFLAEGGQIVDEQGDSMFVSFPRAHAAVRAAVAGQRALMDHRWPNGAHVRVRMGLHTGEPDERDEHYVGLDVHRAARIAAAGHGGQILLSSATRDLVERDLPQGERLIDLGTHRLRHLDRPERLHQLVAPRLPEHHPPLRTLDAEETARRRSRRRAGLASALLGVLAAAIAVPVFVFAAANGGKSIDRIQGDAVGVISAATGRITRSAALADPPGSVAVGGGSAWVASPTAGTVSRVDPRSGLVVQTVKVGGEASDVAVGGGAVWVTSRTDGTLSRIDLASSQLVKRFTIGSGPVGVAYGLGSVWVAFSPSHEIARVDPVSGRVTPVVQLPVAPTGISVGDGSVWVSHESSGSVTRIDPVAGTVTATINVGNGAAAIEAEPGAIWVANVLDGTVSRIDPVRGVVRATIPVGQRPVAFACGPSGVWVANEGAATLSRIDVESNSVRQTIRLGASPKGATYLDGSVLVSARAVASHRGGVLRVAVDRGILGVHESIDPALAYSQLTWVIDSMVGDGLVAFRRVGGPEGASLVPDLAATLPKPTSSGRVYTFRLRPGIRYSDGTLVRARDVRWSLERIFAVGSPGVGYYASIVGAKRCTSKPAACDLSSGIVTDDATGTVVFHLTAPDPEFLEKLAIPFAIVLPSGTPRKAGASYPAPGTGPYRVLSFTPGTLLRLGRNPRFTVWSEAARPDGYPDEIRVQATAGSTLSVRRQLDDVMQGKIDIPSAVPVAQRDRLRTNYPGRVHEVNQTWTAFVLLNTTLPPFDRLAVRQALSYAVDRAEVATAVPGSATCQFLPPGIPGYQAYCPYSTRPNDATSPALLARARRLVTQSGTTGTRIVLRTQPSQPCLLVAQMAARALRMLGYRATLKIVPADDYDSSLEAPNASREGSGGDTGLGLRSARCLRHARCPLPVWGHVRSLCLDRRSTATWSPLSSASSPSGLGAAGRLLERRILRTRSPIAPSVSPSSSAVASTSCRRGSGKVPGPRARRVSVDQGMASVAAGWVTHAYPDCHGYAAGSRLLRGRRAGELSQAAARLGVTQPAVSQQVGRSSSGSARSSSTAPDDASPPRRPGSRLYRARNGCWR